MAELLRWMRDYNARRGDRPELRVAGVDMQDPTGSLNLIRQLAPPNSRLLTLAEALLHDEEKSEKGKKAGDLQIESSGAADLECPFSSARHATSPGIAASGANRTASIEPCCSG